MILGKKVGQGDFAGVIPEAPAVWGYLTHKADGGTWDWTWTAPESGWYSFHLIGDGGSGGKGGEAWVHSQYSAGTGGCGGGGGGHGGYAIHQVYVKKGSGITFVRGSTGISAVIEEQTIAANHGKNGGSADAHKTAGSGGAGGTASGANTLNLTGGAGSAGSAGERSSGDAQSDGGDSVVGGGGGNGGSVPSAQKYSSGRNTGNYNPPNLNLGNGGRGGNGGGASFKYWDFCRKTNPSNGSSGYLGGVVIEAAAT